MNDSSVILIKWLLVNRDRCREYTGLVSCKKQFADCHSLSSRRYLWGRRGFEWMRLLSRYFYESFVMDRRYSTLFSRILRIREARLWRPIQGSKFALWTPSKIFLPHSERILEISSRTEIPFQKIKEFSLIK